MRTSDLDAMEFRDASREHEVRYVGESDSAWHPYGRVLAWCRHMGKFRRFGDWTVQETCSSAACRGTVRARLAGPKGTVEAWNGLEVFFKPKGVKFSKAPYPDNHAEDEANGIIWWPELKFDAGAYEGRSKYGQYAVAAREHFAKCVEHACAMAGIQEAML